MNTDPLAILDSPKIDAEAPLPFTDTDDEGGWLYGGALTLEDPETAGMPRLVRCDSCEEFFKADSELLGDALLFRTRGLAHEDYREHELDNYRVLVCGSCMADIERRSKPQPSLHWSKSPMLSGSSYAPYLGDTITIGPTVIGPGYWNTATADNGASSITMDYSHQTT